jgi:hypothetical protein
MARMGAPAEQTMVTLPPKLEDDQTFAAFTLRNEVRATNNASQWRQVFYEAPASKVRTDTMLRCDSLLRAMTEWL